MSWLDYLMLAGLTGAFVFATSLVIIWLMEHWDED